MIIIFVGALWAHVFFNGDHLKIKNIIKILKELCILNLDTKPITPSKWDGNNEKLRYFSKL